MTAVTDVVNRARGELGTVESPPNSNNQKYGIWYGFNKVPWCAIFVSWVLAKSGVPAYRHASVAMSLDWARKNGRHRSEFRTGFVACRINSGEDWGPGHTGLVEAVHSDGTVTCIEGNTSPGSAGSQRDGGGVWRRRRPQSFWNKQCIDPGPYDGSNQPSTPPPTDGGHDHISVDGDFGSATIRKLQEELNRTGANPRLGVDGDFGPATKRALQARLNHFGGGLRIDGNIGPRTIVALQRHVGATVDGQWGPNTTSALQTKLNQGSF